MKTAFALSLVFGALWAWCLVVLHDRMIVRPREEWGERVSRHLVGAMGWFNRACSSDAGERLRWVNTCDEQRSDVETFTLGRGPEPPDDNTLFAAFAVASTLVALTVMLVLLSRRAAREQEEERLRLRKAHNS